MKFTPRRFKFFLNLYPPYLFSGIRVKYIASDWKESIVQVRKSMLNRNYVGTIFGGTLFSATDPFIMLMLINIMGIKDYIIWDQSAEITFKKPGTSHITYHFKISDEQIKQFKLDAETQGTIRPEFIIEGIDEAGAICTTVRKVIYIKKKRG